LTKSIALEALEHGVAVTLTTPGAPSKPTSMTEAEFLALPDEARARYADDLDVAEAFGWLGRPGRHAAQRAALRPARSRCTGARARLEREHARGLAARRPDELTRGPMMNRP
jgi:NAD(P)-dependent dehydrogenase (short-subunit alcohol dehydrogenase family)